VGKIGAIYNASWMKPVSSSATSRRSQDDLARSATQDQERHRSADGAFEGGRFGASFFSVGVERIRRNPTATLLRSHPDWGLPDRDYYLKDAFKDKKEKYHGYVARMPTWSAADAQKRADEIVAARNADRDASWSRAEAAISTRLIIL